MTLSQFNLDSTLKTLNLSLLRFNKRSGSENFAFKFKLEKSNRILTLVLEAITLIKKVIFYVMKATSASQKLHPNKKLAKPKGTNVRVNQ